MPPNNSLPDEIKLTGEQIIAIAKYLAPKIPEWGNLAVSNEDWIIARLLEKFT